MVLVSIVLPTYNGSKYISKSIESVLNQTFNAFELIIVNDCSTDDTLNICKQFQEKDSRIKIISNPINKKLPESLNVGFENAQGKYFTWTSDDNLYKENALEVMVSYLDSHPNVDMVTCNMERIAEDGKTVNNSEYDGVAKEPWVLAFLNNIGACFLYTKNIASLVGKYDKNMFCAEDYDYWCRIAIKGSIKYLSANLYKYRVHKDSLTFTKREIVSKVALQINTKYLFLLLSKFSYTKDQICSELLVRGFFLKNFNLVLSAFFNYPLIFIKHLKNVIEFLNIKSYLIRRYQNYYANKHITEVIIWGTGEYGKNLNNLLTNFGKVKVNAFTTSFQFEPSIFCEKPLVSPLKAIELYPNSFFIVASDYRFEIFRSVNNKKIKDRMIIASNEFCLFEKSIINLLNKTGIYEVNNCLNSYSVIEHLQFKSLVKS